ncbi:MAG: hypothetical protein WCJ81_00285 [bacterium]
MAKREAPIQEFQDLLNVYVANGWFPWRHKIVKNTALDKLVVVQPDTRIVFMAHIDDTDKVIQHSYSVAELFSVESGIHEFVSRKVHGHAWKREGQPSVHDVGYSYQYMNMAMLTICQKMEYFLRMSDVS